MIRELILKELHDNLLSLRFQVGLLLALVLVSVSAFVLSTSYQRERSEHFQRLNQEDEVLRGYAHFNRFGMMTEPRRPPSPMVLVRGLSDEARVETLDANPMLELHPPMDLTAIVAVILSLLGIVIGFDALNSEKERGTLRLMLANQLRRFDVVIAKWVSGTLALVLAFVVAVLFGLVILRLRSGAEWGNDDWLSFTLVCLVSLLYGGVFFSLALTFSAVFHRSSISVLASLFAWVVFVLVIPNISPYVAAQIVHLPSRAALTRDKQYLTSDERDELGRAGQRKVTEKYRNQFQFGDLAPDDVKRRAATDPEFRRLYDQYRREVEAVWNEVNQIQNAKAERLEDAWQSLAESQFRLSKKLSYASPLPPLIYATTELCLTGFGSREDFDRQAEAYGRVLDGYLDARFSEEQKKDPTFSWNDFLDVSTRPRFSYVAPSFEERLETALPFIAFLVGWNLLFFTTAIFSFLRFDVR